MTNASARLRGALRLLMGFAAVCLIYCIGLGRNPLIDPDEPIYGQFVKEMVSTGNWLTPHYSGHLWFDKPPLFYWISSICVKIMGCTEFAIRFPSALFAALTVVGVYLLASHDFGKRIGMLSAAVMGTTLLQVILSHAAATDSIMTFCFVAALFAYRRWIDEAGYSRLCWIAGCGAAVGLGMLTKGPVVPVLVGAIIFAHLIWTGNIRRILSCDALLGIVMCLIIGLPWYVAMYMMHRETFVEQFVMANNLTRFVKPLHASQSAHWYSHFRSIGMLLLFFFPWNVFLPQAIMHSDRANPGSRLAICWAAVIVVFFSLSKTQNFTYTYPAFPACAILVGILLNREELIRAFNKFESKRYKTGMTVGLALSGLMAGAILLLVRSKFPSAQSAAIATGCLLISIYAIPLICTRIRMLGVMQIPAMITAVTVAFSLIAINVMMPQVSEYTSSRRIAHQVSQLPNATVATFGLWKPGLFYYLGKEPIMLKHSADIKKMASSSVSALIVCKERDEAKIEKYTNAEVSGYGDLDVYANKAYQRAYLVTAQALPELSYLVSNSTAKRQP